MVKPTEKINILLLTIKFPLKWYHWRKQLMKDEGGEEASKSRISSFLLPFLYKRLEKWP